VEPVVLTNYNLVTYRFWWGNLIDITLSADKIIILFKRTKPHTHTHTHTHTHIQTNICLYLYVYKPRVCMFGMEYEGPEKITGKT
jgi:hypothetical protein